MKNKELEEKLNKINDELNKINEKLKDSTDTMVIKGMYAKDELDDKIEDSINEAKEKLEDKREARDKEKLEKYIDNRLEYTSDCIALALTLASEAKLSFLEALEAQAELDEK